MPGAGAGEVAGAVTAATATTVSVFLPIVFVEGIAGQLFRDQALTVTVSLLASLVVAVSLIPMLSAAGARLPRAGSLGVAPGKLKSVDDDTADALFRIAAGFSPTRLSEANLARGYAIEREVDVLGVGLDETIERLEGFVRPSGRNLERITGFLRDLQPDLIGLVEVDHGSFRSDGRNQVEILATNHLNRFFAIFRQSNVQSNFF